MEELILSFVIVSAGILYWFRKSASKTLKASIPFGGAYFVLMSLALLHAVSTDLTLTRSISNTLVQQIVIALRVMMFSAAGTLLLQQSSHFEGVRDTDMLSVKRIAWIPVFTASVSFVGYSWILMTLVFPGVARNIEIDSPGILTNRILWSVASSINEESMFRAFVIGVTCFILKGALWQKNLAVLVSTIAWSYLHTSAEVDETFKIVQTLPFGVFVGFLYFRSGLASCVAYHALSNSLLLVSIGVQTFLIK